MVFKHPISAGMGPNIPLLPDVYGFDGLPTFPRENFRNGTLMIFPKCSRKFQILCPMIVGRTLNSLMDKVERMQYQAALAITGAWQGTSRSKIYDELGWEALSDRRKCRCVLQIHKIRDNNTLSYLKKITFKLQRNV